MRPRAMLDHLHSMLPITWAADSPSAPAIALRIAIIAAIHFEIFPGSILSFDMILAILD